MTTQQALDLLEKLIARLKVAEKDRDATGLSPEAFAVFYVLMSDGVEDPLKAAQAGESIECLCRGGCGDILARFMLKLACTCLRQRSGARRFTRM